MDTIFELLKQLYDVLANPITFVLVLILIGVCTFFSVQFLNSKGGLLSLFKGESKEPRLLGVVKSQLEALSAAHAASVEKIMDAITELREKEKENSEAIRKQIADYALLQKDLSAAKIEMNRGIEDIKILFRLHEQNDIQMHQNVKELLQRVLDLLSHMNTELEKIDEYVRSIMPEFRSDHKEIGRGITELSKDIALIERTIQTQINSNGITLR